MGWLVYIFFSRVFATLPAQSGVCLCPGLKAFVNVPCSLNTPKITWSIKENTAPTSYSSLINAHC